MSAPAFYLLAYDISDDRRRAKIAKIMEAMGARVQGSVFEAYLTPVHLETLLKKVNKTLKKEEDSLRIYPLCENCREKIRTVGRGQATPPPEVMIV